jgi:hypothetical protein
MPSSEPSLAPSQVCYPNTRRVKIQATTSDHIQVFELKVFSSGSNIAQGKTATRSSTYGTLGADRAVDGLLSLFSHTANSGSGAWLKVDVGSASDVNSITIENRWCTNKDDPHGCLCRLSSAELILYNDNGDAISTVYL